MSCPDHLYDKIHGNMGRKHSSTKKHLKQRYLILKQGGGGLNSFGRFFQEMNVRPLKFEQRQNQSKLCCIQK